MTVVCSGVDSGGVIGTGGSLARFTIVQNYLYAVIMLPLLRLISQPLQMVLENQQNVGFGIETFPFDNTLFIGSNTGVHLRN